ncbi:MAG: glycosyltransferase family 9 protein, partial [Egibacteraceae bacterium]
MALDQPRLVVLRALGLGDLLTAAPALRGLARAFPAHRRTLLAPASLTPLVALLDGAVHDVADVDYRQRVDAALPRGCHRADIAVNLHGRGPESHTALLATRPTRLLAFAHPDVPASADGPPWHTDEHETRRWCRLLTAFGVDADADGLDLRVEPAPEARGATVIHPGAASPARRWPVERWATVA